MHTTYLLLGGNLGNPIENIETAYHKIEERVGSILLRSSFYESEPWGFEHSQNFINAAIKVETELNANQVLEEILKIETEMGRSRDVGKITARPIDIDIQFFDDKIINDDQLTIPHPRMHLRNFALVPLADIAADVMHPILRKDIAALLQNSEDKSEVKKVILS